MKNSDKSHTAVALPSIGEIITRILHEASLSLLYKLFYMSIGLFIVTTLAIYNQNHKSNRSYFPKGPKNELASGFLATNKEEKKDTLQKAKFDILNSYAQKTKFSKPNLDTKITTTLVKKSDVSKNFVIDESSDHFSADIKSGLIGNYGKDGDSPQDNVFNITIPQEIYKDCNYFLTYKVKGVTGEGVSRSINKNKADAAGFDPEN